MNTHPIKTPGMTLQNHQKYGHHRRLTMEPTDHHLSMQPLAQRRQLLLAAAASTLAVVLAGCSTPPPPPKPVTMAPPPEPVAPPPPPPPVVVEVPPEPVPIRVSAAMTARDYRRDAAAHLYERNSNRIFKGKLPPLLYAVGVLEIEVDKMGMISSINWMRAPSHAPHVMAEIERTVREAAPFPAPVQLGRVVYTETWLWHRSGRFQLDTLTEGQS
jgi:periplasmic protein TonB